MDSEREMRTDRKDRKDHGQHSKRRDFSRSASESAEENIRKERHHRRQNTSPSGDSDLVEGRSHRKKSNRHRSRSTSRDREGRHRGLHDDRKYRHRSRSGERSHHRRRSRSPPTKRRKRSRNDESSDVRSPVPHQKSRAPLPSQNESFRGNNAAIEGDGPAPDKQKPNFRPTGLLAKEANTVIGTTTVLKYHEPPEARKPPTKEAWRMYVFKGKDLVDTIYLHQRSAWLVGRDQKVTDYLLEHPSISKQHAVIQFRHITSTNEYGDKSSRVKPYLIDLESANGTKMNGKAVEASRFVELVDGDVVVFGESEREYVMMLPPP